MKRASVAGSIRLTGLALAGIAAEWACPGLEDARGEDKRKESLGVRTPDERITGSTSSRDAKGAPLKEEQALLDKVVKALVDDSQLHGANIHVKVERDSVVLTGKARNASQADHARDVAQNAASRARVESKLRTG